MRQAALPSTFLILLLFLGLPGGSSPAPAHTALATASSSMCGEFHRALEAELGTSGKVDVLIATVPDPDTSGLTYAFDLWVDAIQRALAQADYTFASFWLPWRPEADAGTECRDLPGFLSARRPSSETPGVDDRLLVLLVGETATSGVNGPQMDCATHLADPSARPDGRGEGCGRPPGTSPRWLGVLGPTFSGAAPSLRDHLRDAGVLIVSGSATGKDLPLGDRFRRTVLPDDLVLNALLAFLKQHGATSHQIAVLVESNTVYGSGLSAAVDGGVHLRIPFPLGVHRLREEQPQQPQPSVPFGTLGLPLQQDRVVGRSTVSQFSRTSESYDERRLEDTLQSLARRNVRFVGILATNDLDKLFLATRVRAFCPDATLFTLESSLLFTHPDQARVAAGMLVASTYPLIPLNQEWTPWSPGKEEVVQTFGTGTAEGVFNATLVLLGSEEMADYTTPFVRDSAFPPVWITVVGNGSMWPVAVTATDPDAGVIGRLHRGPIAGLHLRQGLPRDHDSAPWGVVGAFLLASAWVVLRTLSFWWAAWRADSHGQGPRVPAVLLPFGDLPYIAALRGPAPKLALIAPASEVIPSARGTLDSFQEAFRVRRREVATGLRCVFLTILGGYGLVVWLALLPAWKYGTFGSWRRAVIAAVAGFVVGLGTFTAVGAPLVGSKSVRERGLPLAELAGAAGALTLVLALGPFVASRIVPDDLLWYERSIAFTSGVTIVVPLAALWLGIYLFVQGHVQSLVNAPIVLHRRRRLPENPLVEVLTGSLPDKPTSDDTRQILARDLHAASWPRWSRQDVIGPALAAALPIVGLVAVHRSLLDRAAEHVLLLTGMSLGLIALAWSLHRVFSGTDALLRLLRFFALEPGFDRLTPFFQTLPHKEFGRFQVLHPNVRFLAEFATKFHREGPSNGSDQARGQDAWAGQLGEDLRTYDRWPAWGSRTFESIRRAALVASRKDVWTNPQTIPFSGSDPDLTTIGSYAVLVISWALTSIRNFLILAAILSAALWVAFVSYPQSPHHLLLVAAWLAMALCLVVGVVTFVRFDRNDVLSRMSRTKEGKASLDLDFFKSNLPLVLGPALAIVVLEFPQFGRWLSEWAQPLLRSLK